MRGRDVFEGDPPFWLTALALGLVSASRFLALAAFPGEIDEAVFAGAVRHYDLFDLSPQAPGFPVWILIGRALLPLTGSAFDALAIAATVLSALAFPALYLWGRRFVGGWAALSGTLLAAALPVVWVNGGRAFSDTPATAFFLLSLALLSYASAAPRSRDSHVAEASSARRARLLALLAGFAAAAGAGVRPHLVLAFAPVLLLETVELLRKKERREAAWTFVLAGLAGTLAWGGWLMAQAGGRSGLVASLHERTEFRAHAFATGTFGALGDSFLVRDFLSGRRAALVFALALYGAFRLGRRAVPILTILVPTFLSLWFLHSRAMSRYSVPFVLVLSLLVGAGLVALARRPALGLLGGALAAAVYARETYPEVRWSARELTPPMAAIRYLERWVHSGRETLIVDPVFHPFLRLERWEGRLVAWGLFDAELVSARPTTNRRWVRLSDFTSEVDPPDRTDPAWRTWWHGGRVAEALGNRRLLAVSVREPAGPLFGPGFGVRETLEGKPSFRWSGPEARVIVPGLQGPPVAILLAERPTEAGPTTLTVTDALTSRTLVSRLVQPGLFELALIPEPVYGPLSGPREYVVRCDRPKPLPPLPGAVRPRKGCFVFREATLSVSPEALWQRHGSRLVADIGASRDGWVDLEGFHAREALTTPKLDMRWTGPTASVVYEPSPSFTPKRLVVRARPPAAEDVVLTVRIAGRLAGTLTARPGDFAEYALTLPPDALKTLASPMPARIELSSATWSPKRAGKGDDARELGVGVDWIALE